MAIELPPGALFPDSVAQRRGMVERQVRTFDVSDQVVIAGLIEVPREVFVAPAQRPLAYSDLPLDLPGETGPRTRQMLPPLILARMVQAAAPQRHHRVLDVAGGTGYTAAVFAALVRSVVALESDAILSTAAEANFAALGLGHVQAVHGPLRDGLPGSGPYDIVFINGCVEAHFETLASQLAAGGRMIAIMPKASGTLQAVQIEGHGEELSFRPLFDTAASRLEEFKRAPAFVF